MERCESCDLPEKTLCEQVASSDRVAELQSENEELRKELTRVMTTASANEAIWRHFAEIERILFRTRELDQLVEELLREIRVRFQTDQVALFLCNPDLLERFFPELSTESEPIDEDTWILPLPMDASQDLCGDPPRPFLLTPESIGGLRRLFPELAGAIRSGVFIPLCIHEILFGGLFLGSDDANHYQPEDGTDLLEQLGVKIALCMDNCLAYEKVKDFTLQEPLTGLLNIFQVRTVLEREFSNARRLNTPLSVLSIAFNFFNETSEHSQLANEIIKHAANVLRGILPQDESHIGRNGSAEFLVLLPGVQEEEAREVVPYLKKMILKSPFKHQNAVILIQATIGVGWLDDVMKRPQELLDAAYQELCSLRMSHAQTHRPAPIDL